MFLWDIEPGVTVTVTKVIGDRNMKKELENQAIMIGSDLTVLKCSCVDENHMKVSNGRWDVELSMETASKIQVSEEFRRHNDPVLLSGCCGGGTTVDLMDRMDTHYGKHVTKE